MPEKTNVEHLGNHPTVELNQRALSSDLIQTITAHYQAENELRKGICLLNAGEFEQAESAFRRAEQLGVTDQPLASYLAACLMGQQRPLNAADELAKSLESSETDGEVPTRIRHALALWSAGQCDNAVESLREEIRRNPETAELHFQLGTLLASIEQYDEAELRFTQTLSIDRDHAEALIGLALCCGIRGAPSSAVDYLQRAQLRRPHDVRMAILLTQAAKAVRQQGLVVRVHASMAGDRPAHDRKGIEELSHVIESDPDFVDAFLAIPVGAVDKEVFTLLLETLELALERQPEHPELHYHCGRILERLGRPNDAIQSAERAVHLNPRFTRALIELGRLYRQTDRAEDAASRLEQAIAAGAEYADVYCLLGHLYRDQGQWNRARSAYTRALGINADYAAARNSLAELPF